MESDQHTGVCEEKQRPPIGPRARKRDLAPEVLSERVREEVQAEMRRMRGEVPGRRGATVAAPPKLGRDGCARKAITHVGI